MSTKISPEQQEGAEVAPKSVHEKTLGETCEELLASRKWNSAQTITIGGLKKRLKMIEDAGLPRMRVLSQRKLKELGRIPRSNEDKQEDALDAVIRCGADIFNIPKAIIFFYSHRWKRGNWCEELQKDMAWGSAEREQAMKEGKIFGDPDDAEHSKAKALIAYGEWFKRVRVNASSGSQLAVATGGTLSNDEDLEIFWWIDWCCTDQDKLLPKRSADEPGRDSALLLALARGGGGLSA